MKVVDFFQDLWFELVVGSDIPRRRVAKVQEEWVPSEVLDSAVASIAEVRREVVVVEEVALPRLHLLQMGQHLQMVCSRLCLSQVVRVLWRRRRR